MTSELRYIEKPEENGFRFVGFADELADLRHTGWYTDDDGDLETIRGAVYQLPARKGCVRFVSGYQDPYGNDAAILDLGVCCILEGEERAYYSNHASDWPEACEAARRADRIAELDAEKEIDFQRAWQASRDFEELGEEVKTKRRDTLTLIKELKTVRHKVDEDETPTICAILRQQIAANLASIGDMRKQREELQYSYADQDGWNE